MLNHFENQYGLNKYILVPYGSRVYGTHTDKSDYDYICIAKGLNTGEEYRNGNLNIHLFDPIDFQNQLHDHKIHTLEAYYHPDNLCSKFDFKLDLVKLRHELSQKASHSFVKAKKKIEVEKDYYIGWKSLFHSLRILTFGKTLATTGKIIFNEANEYWFEILNAQQYNWNYFKTKYQPIYNTLSTEFKKVAPKE